jgi:hypothetical protein
MEEFVPFHVFQQRLHDARFEEDQEARARQPRPQAPAGDTEADEDKERRLNAYLDVLNRNAEVVHSYVTPEGDCIDCMKIASQPGLAGQAAYASPPVGVPGVPPAQQGGPAEAAQGLNQGPDEFEHIRRCPPGTIPVRRVGIEELRRAGTLRRYFQKAPGGGAMPPPPPAGPS